MNPARRLECCLACGAADPLPYLDLGDQPLANSYHDGGGAGPEFPLGVAYCPSCWHSQLTVAVDPALLFRHYLYVSGTTKTLVEYFRWFAGFAAGRACRAGPLAVLDIASNDGSLLKEFAAAGHAIQGVDPAENLAPLAEAAGVPTEVAYWSLETAARLGRRFDVIVAMNVLGHNADPLAFMEASGAALAPNGRIYVQTSQAEMIARGEFDTIYHEHHSFFSTRSFAALCRRAGLHLVSGRKVPVHGTSYLWEVAAEPTASDGTIEAMDVAEERLGYYDAETYTRFGERVVDTADFVTRTIADFRERGYAAIGYGAAAKGNTFLNFAGLDLDYIVDDNPMKHGLRTPGRNIPIVGPETLAQESRPVACLILAWNFYDEVMARIVERRQRDDDRFIRFFPEREIGAP